MKDNLSDLERNIENLAQEKENLINEQKSLVKTEESKREGIKSNITDYMKNIQKKEILIIKQKDKQKT